MAYCQVQVDMNILSQNYTTLLDTLTTTVTSNRLRSMFMPMMYYTVDGSICGKWHALMVNVEMQMLCSQLGNRGKK